MVVSGANGAPAAIGAPIGARGTGGTSGGTSGGGTTGGTSGGGTTGGTSGGGTSGGPGRAIGTPAISVTGAHTGAAAAGPASPADVWRHS